MNKDANPDHWKLLLFYYNPDEPRLFVPRRWTGTPFMLNFAKPGAWIIAAVTLLAAIAIFAGTN